MNMDGTKIFESYHAKPKKRNVQFGGTDDRTIFICFQIASLVSGLLADKFGRRHVTMICILLLVKTNYYSKSNHFFN